MQSNNQQKLPKREDMKPQYSKKKKKHGVALTILIILLIVLCGGLAKGYQMYKEGQKSAGEWYQSGDTHKLRDVSNVINQDKPFSVLLLGTDTGALGRNDVGRTDTMILATVNPKMDTINLTSIPRDTQVSVPGDSQPYEKINAAYTIGGPSSAVQSVQNLLNVPIDFYAIINMGGLEKMVNAVGGVTVNPKLTFKYGNANVVKGKKQLLNGAQALDYSRMRHEDPLGDYGRQARQREVLQKLVMKGMQISSLTRYHQILQSLNGNIKTDMQFNDMISIRARYGDATHHIKSETLQGQDATINGIDYQVPTQNEIDKVSAIVRKSLGMNPQSPSSNSSSGNSSSSTDSSSNSGSNDNSSNNESSYQNQTNDNNSYATSNSGGY
ncbi:LytR family transcriptional regulator [Philodulcilactobacillus myokoensis]|uniref:LytR family transcriptional regulator n=1 Tax=Philodulcilactobacillus myokoensis TaxID=2929573 RepID=A0A9W6B2G0_9LACO|nr:LCP family protein [Philodulcilactobacillus myokoensis]GLB47188.1 LytR family transcriptional regulator [Philodulcilactobacillus myokoensis]